MLRTGKFSTAWIFFIILAAQSSAQCASSDFAQFDWPNLAPSTVLTWTDCYTGGLQCARLEVPLDYANSTSETATIALVRFPSPLGQDSPDYLGPLLINPGGPGGSGVSLIVDGGISPADIRARTGDGYDVIGFDPRGVGRSTPQAQLFPPVSQYNSLALSEINAAIGEAATLSQPGGIGIDVATARLINTVYGTVGSSYLPFMNTPFTAQDMLQIVKAHGREELNYYGISYGTVLGVVFATMFPDNVGRMVLDGVTDSDAWFSGNVSASLLDADKAIDVFFQSCFEAGPEGCAFFDSSPEKISANLNALYDQVKAEPVPSITADSFGLVDYSLLRNVVFNAAAMPYVQYPLLAVGLAQLAAGNGSSLFDAGSNNPFDCGLNDTDLGGMGGLSRAVTCNDAAVLNMTLSQWQDYFDDAAQVSEYADVFAQVFLRCQGWTVATKNPVRGPWGGNTSTEILFIGNTADPLTPVVNAKKMSSLFPGSIVLTQNSTGHTSIVAPSNCTVSHVAQYLGNGTLPPPDTICQVDIGIFPSSSGV